MEEPETARKEPTPTEIMILVQAQMAQAQAMMDKLAEVGRIVERMIVSKSAPS